MENGKIKLVIAEDNSDFSDALVDCLMTREDMEIMEVASDGLEALKYIDKYKPDVLILDIIMPNLDGFGVMERLNSMRTEDKPKVIILSAIGQESITQKAVNLGAEYYAVKPFDMDVFINRIVQLFQINNSYQILRMPPTLPNVKKTARALTDEINDLLLETGVPHRVKGYQFLCEAIQMVVEDEILLKELSSEVYPTIAFKYETTPRKVERAINHAIEVAVKQKDSQATGGILSYYFETCNKKPTNGEFIAAIADKLRIKRIN